MRGFIFLLLMCWCAIGWGQISTFQKFYGGSGDDDGREIIEVTNRAYIIIGSTGNFDAQSSDILIFKIDSFGNVLWKKVFGTNGVDRGISIKKTNRGFAVLAQTNGKGSGGYDFNFLLLDTLGNVLLDKTYGGPEWDIANSFVMTFDSCFVLAGYSNSFGNGNNEGYLLKINMQGDTLWTKHFGGQYDETINSITQANDSNFYATGQTKNEGDTLGDISVFKLDSLGGLIWKKKISTNYEDEGFTITKKFEGGLVIGTHFGDSDTSGVAHAYGLDFDGNINWTFETGANTDAAFYNVYESSDSKILLTGYYKSFVLNDSTSAGNGGLEGIYAYVDTSGNFNIASQFGFDKNEIGYSIIQSSDGGILILGTSNSLGFGLNDIILRKFQTFNPNLITYDLNTTLNIRNLDKSVNSSFKIYPTLINDYIIILTKGINKIQIADVLGKVIFEMNLSENVNSHIVDFNLISAGLYFVKAYNNEEVFTKKIIKK